MEPAEIPEQFFAYTSSFLRAMAAITSDITGFNDGLKDDGLKDAYRQHQERYPPEGDIEDDH